MTYKQYYTSRCGPGTVPAGRDQSTAHIQTAVAWPLAPTVRYLPTVVVAPGPPPFDKNGLRGAWHNNERSETRKNESPCSALHWPFACLKNKTICVVLPLTSVVKTHLLTSSQERTLTQSSACSLNLGDAQIFFSLPTATGTTACTKQGSPGGVCGVRGLQKTLEHYTCNHANSASERRQWPKVRSSRSPTATSMCF